MRNASVVLHDAERETYLVLDDLGGRLDCRSARDRRRKR